MLRRRWSHLDSQWRRRRSFSSLAEMHIVRNNIGDADLLPVIILSQTSYFCSFFFYDAQGVANAFFRDKIFCTRKIIATMVSK